MGLAQLECKNKRRKNMGGNDKLTDNALVIAADRYFMEGETWEDCANRVGTEVSRAENGHTLKYGDEFSEMIYNMDFLPGGRILRNTRRARGSLFNCYVLPIGDSIEEIGQFMKDSLILWSEGGGVGVNYSNLRPRGAVIKGKGGVSSGPVSFLEASEALANTIESGGSRRAAAMGLMHVSHPDILEFIDVKLTHGKLEHYNLSVAVNDDFLEAVEADKDWNFKFAQLDYGKIKARVIWDKIIKNMVSSAEPGLLNWENLTSNNSYYFDPILSTNPCGEVPLGSYGVCDLGSIVLPNFVKGRTTTNWKKMEYIIKLIVRFLDNVIDINKYVLKEVDINAHSGRRIGIGVMGLAEYLFAKKLRYGSKEAIYEIERLMRFIRDTVYEASIELAIEKGAFPQFDSVNYGKAHFIRSLPVSMRMSIKKHGIRNVSLMAIAPTGCQNKDTMIVTNKGILSLEEMGDINGNKWQNIDFKVVQENLTEEISSKFYVNGKAKTKKIYLKSGNILESTYNHQYRMLENGNYLWRRADELNIGDDVVSVLGTYNKKSNPDLSIIKTTHGNQNTINIISSMNEKLAEFIGIYFGDGSNHNKGIRINCDAHNEGEYLYVADLGKNLFGIEPTFYDNKRNCMSVCFNSQLMLKNFEINGFLKQKSNEISIPKIIRMSSRSCIAAFIKGLIFADGSKSGNNIYLDTASEKLKKELLVIIRALGNDVRAQEHISGFGSKIFRIWIKKGIYKFRSLSDQKKKRQLEKLGLNNCVVDEIIKIENSENYTCDIEVPKTTTYIANSIVSHNTISLLPEATSGIEPLPYKAYKRADRVSDRIYVHSMYKEMLNGELGKDAKEWYVDTTDLEPTDHFETQSIIQKYVDGALSKTINLQKGTTVEQLSDITLEYIHDLKGVTVYVDGSRKNQPIAAASEKEVKAYLKNNKKLIEESPIEMSCVVGSCEM